MEDVMTSLVFSERSGSKRVRDDQEEKRLEKRVSIGGDGGFFDQIMSKFESSDEGVDPLGQNGDLGMKKEEDLSGGGAGGGGGEDDGGGGGFFSRIMSNFGSSNEGGDEVDQNGHDVCLKKEDLSGGGGGGGGGYGSGDGGGGVVNNFISNYFHQSENGGNGGGGGEGNVAVSGGDEVEKVVEEGGGGIVKNFISNIFHHGEGGGGDDEKDNVVDDGEAATASNGGVIDNSVSHLPKSLAENKVPGTDEASILIHSIIHD